MSLIGLNSYLGMNKVFYPPRTGLYQLFYKLKVYLSGRLI